MVDTPRRRDPPPLDPTDRDALRRRLRAERAALAPGALRTAAVRLHEHCLPLVDDAHRVAGYRAIRGEIDVASILAHCRRRGASTFVPVIDAEGMRFAPIDEQTEWTTGTLGIDVPIVEPAALVEPMTLDVVLVPLVGFDAAGNRLGMGGGYYDRAFASRREAPAPPWLIGCAHALQRVDALPVEAWDVPLDFVATDAGVYERGRRNVR